MMKHIEEKTDRSLAGVEAISILYVEDEPEIRELVSRALVDEHPQYPLFTAANGAEGLAVFRERRPQIVITDIMMPVMDGLAMAKEIIAVDPDVELIALTAYSDTNFLLSAIEAGFSHYVIKPIDVEKLLASVQKSLEVLKMKHHANQWNERLRQSEQRLQATFDQAAVGISHIALDGTFLRINQRYREIVGCLPEAPCLTIFDNTHPQDMPECRIHHQLILNEKLPSYSLEKRYVHIDGSIVWAMLTISMVRGPDEEPAFLVAIIHDITARKQAEEERNKAEEELRLSEQKFTTIFHSVPAAITISSYPQGRCIDINEAGLRMLGYKRSDIIGQSWLELGTWEPPLLSEVFLQTLGEQGKVHDFEVMLKTKDGRHLTALLSAEPVIFAGSRYLLSIFTDITRRKQLQAQVNELNAGLVAKAAELENANEELKAFNHTVAHDLRKPLTAVNACCQVIEEMCGEKLGAECMVFLREAYEGTFRMNRLIDVLLQFSEAAHAEIRPEKVDLTAIAEQVAEELKLAEPERKVVFRIQMGMLVMGDANLLRVAISNLLGNAWKYTLDREEAFIEFSSTELDGKTVFFVRDNGIGFDNAEAEDIFLPFRRIRNDSRIGGLGIGLGTVHRIIKRHGGKVWAEGEPGIGATFCFYL